MKLKYEFSIQEVADKFVAVAKNLNETGAVILKALQDGEDVPAIVDQLLSQYDIEAQEAEDEVKAFINILTENGLTE